MSKVAATAIALLLFTTPTLAACGDEDSDGTAAARPSAMTPAPSPESEMPADLVGTWRTTLKLSELVDPPDDLTMKTSVGKLKFLGTGGIDNGPSMYFAREELGEGAQPVSISGEQITLETPTPCQIYSYAIDDERLTLTSIESGCPSTGVSSVLTAPPWRRTSG